MTKALAPHKPTAVVAAEAEPSKPASLMAFAEMALRSPDITVEKLQAVLGMMKDAEAADAEAQFNQAMLRLQPRLPRIKKNGVVEYQDKQGKPLPAYTYAKWEDVDAAIRGIMHEEGFVLSFDSKRNMDGGGVIVYGELRHEAGHVEKREFALPLDTGGGKNNLQGYASSLTFGKRYVTQMLLNLIYEDQDDDGVKGGAPETLTPEQKAAILKLAGEVKADLPAFLAYMKAPTVEMIPAADYERATRALEQKRRAKV